MYFPRATSGNENRALPAPQTAGAARGLLARVAAERAAAVVTPDFKTTVDKTEWHG